MKDALRKMVYADIGFEDITTNALIPHGIEVEGKIISKEKGIVAGVDVAVTIFNEFGIKTSIKKNDGNEIKPEDTIIEIKGNARAVLSAERTVLNLLMKLSGISTLTSNIVKRAKKVNEDIIIAGTRKTTPGLQYFEKKAIQVGGGDTHRLRLDDCVLIKDNHIAIVGDVEKAVEKAKKNVSFTKKIEIEVENIEDAVKAIKAGADIIMLDNMSPDEIKKVISTLKGIKLRNKALIEVSGGINPENVVDYAETGVDIISMGYITHSAKSLDMSLELI